MDSRRVMYISMILAVPFFKPGYFSQIPFLDILYTGSKVVSFLFIAVIYFISRRKISKIMISILILQCYLLIPTILYHGDLMNLANSSIMVVGLCMLTEIMIEADFLAFCKGLLIPFSILSIVNLVTLIYFPKGLYYNATHWFLGQRGGHIGISLPCVYISFLISHFTKKRINALTVMFLAIAYVSAILVWAATAMIALAMMIIYILLLYNRENSRVFNFFNYCVVSASMFLFITVFRMQDRLAFLIEGILKKSLTLTDRTLLWDIIINLIAQRPILGYGFDVGEGLVQKNIPTAHSFFLQYAYWGGFIAILLVAIIVFLSGKNLMKYKSNQISRIISFVAFIYFTIFLSDSYFNFHHFYVLLVMAYHVETIVGQQAKFDLSYKAKTAHPLSHPQKFTLPIAAKE